MTLRKIVDPCRVREENQHGNIESYYNLIAIVLQYPLSNSLVLNGQITAQEAF